MRPPRLAFVGLGWIGTLRRLTPLSQHWGADRGTPMDRYYVRRFLDAHPA